MKRSAFGLIELLVVLCLVSILISIGIPSFTVALGRSRSNKCQANLRQIGVATSNYLADNDQSYPLSYGAGNPPLATTWMQKLAPYVGIGDTVMGPAPRLRSTGVFNCPEFRPNGRLAGYALNCSITQTHWNFRPLRVSDSTILIVEIDANADLFDPRVSGDVIRRHPSQSGNFLFVDGHVENNTVPIPASDARWSIR